MNEFKLQKTKDGDIIECDSCGCEVPTGDYDWGPPFNIDHFREKRPLCEFCATTMAGRRTEEPVSQREPLAAEIWKAAAAVANHIKFNA